MSGSTTPPPARRCGGATKADHAGCEPTAQVEGACLHYGRCLLLIFSDQLDARRTVGRPGTPYFRGARGASGLPSGSRRLELQREVEQQAGPEPDGAPRAPRVVGIRSHRAGDVEV